MYKIEPFQFSFENCRICGHPPRGKRFCYWCGASLDIDDKEPYDKRSLEEQHGGLSCSVVHGRGKHKQSHEEWINEGRDWEIPALCLNCDNVIRFPLTLKRYCSSCGINLSHSSSSYSEDIKSNQKGNIHTLPVRY